MRKRARTSKTRPIRTPSRGPTMGGMKKPPRDRTPLIIAAISLINAIIGLIAKTIERWPPHWP